MNIHEYQAKKILKEYDVNVLNGYLVKDIKEIEKVFKKIETDQVVIKAQIHAGGRGKAGGVKFAKTLDEAVNAAKNLIGKKLVTHQTDKKGVLVRNIYIEESCSIKNEYYLSLVLDRKNNGITFVASTEGGMEIEEVAKNIPEKIIELRVDSFIGLRDYQIRFLIDKLKIPEILQSDIKKTLNGIFKAFNDKNCNLIEINPLVLTEKNELIALDAKMSFDDNALFKHDDILKLKDNTEKKEQEIEAEKHGISYVSLDGDIGCMVNGAGLAMATMDSISDVGGSPANFLDVGGSAAKENIKNAFKIILSDSKVKGVFINIFGGIIHCDLIAEGIIQASKEAAYDLPIVTRLEGSNVEKGSKILHDSSLEIYTASSMAEGAQKIVDLTRKEHK